MNTESQANRFDAIVVGGSYAGLSAALQLGRARRKILIIDEGRRRNRFVNASHGFLGQDGTDPAVIADIGRSQLLAYPTVKWLADRAVDAVFREGGFAVAAGNGQEYHGKRLVLALGVADELPAIPGLAERWGKSVFHCPYCHGYELDNGRIGVIASSEASMHHALMLPDWGTVTLFTNSVFTPDEEQSRQLKARGVSVEPAPVTGVVGHADVVLKDGRVMEMDGLFSLSRTHIASPLADNLGCEYEEGPLGRFIKTNMMKETTVPGIFACGDAARAAGSVALAVGDGVVAGTAAHRSLIFSQ